MGFLNRCRKYMKIMNKLNMALILAKNKSKYVIFGLLLMLSVPNSAYFQGLYSNENIGPVADMIMKPYYSGATLPEIGPREASRTMYISVTAYNSEPGQTDDTPFITAFGTHVRDGIVATNFLPKGTIVRFPDYYGDKEFVVEDRMNSRYHYKVDIWMEHKTDAIQFGHRYLKMEIL